MQRELAQNMIVDVAYVGNRADDILLFAKFNAPNGNRSAAAFGTITSNYDPPAAAARGEGEFVVCATLCSRSRREFQ